MRVCCSSRRPEQLLSTRIAAGPNARGFMATILPLTAIDPPLVEDLLDAAFGPGRHARTAYRIRTGMDWLPALSFAALDEDDWLVGSIQLWPVALTDPQGRAHPLLMVGPVAVMPGRQGEGFGKALMATALAAADAPVPSGALLPQVLIGDLDYYGQWNFFGEPYRRLALPRPVGSRPPAGPLRQSGGAAPRGHARPLGRHRRDLGELTALCHGQGRCLISRPPILPQ